MNLRQGDSMYHFIINSNSRSGKGIRIWSMVKEELDKKHIDYMCYFTCYKNHAITITKEICEGTEGIKNIVVLGGDGTVNEVINGVETFDDVILGYIPTGSSNDLARSLGLSKNPIECLEHILYPTHFDFLDIGSIKLNNIDERKFVVSTGIGFDAGVCEETFRSKLKKVLNKIGLGKLTYIIIAVKQILTSPLVNAEVQADEKNISFKNALLITSMIHKYEGGGVKICPTANPRDGLLTVCVVHGIGRLKALFLMPTLTLGKHTSFKGVDSFHCKQLLVNLEQPSHVHVDGEYPGLYQDIKVTCHKRQLRIII